MPSFKVSVKHNKKKHSGLALNTDEPLLVFQKLVQQATGLQPEEQQLIGQGKVIKDGPEPWAKLRLRNNFVFMVTQKVGAVAAPTKEIVFEEDTKALANPDEYFPAGLVNVGNTCYLNSVVQNLRYVPEFVESLDRPEKDDSVLVPSLRGTFNALNRSKEPVNMGAGFVSTFWTMFPQFNERDEHGIPQQQDAEEAWTQLMQTFRQEVGRGVVDRLFRGTLQSTVTCAETDEEPAAVSEEHFFSLSCHIAKETAHLLEGLRTSLVGDMEKNSAVLGRSAVFHKTSRLHVLPKYMTVQFVRFFWRSDINKRTKITRPVSFPTGELDLFDLCSDDLREQLKPARARIEARDAAIQEAELTGKHLDVDGDAVMADLATPGDDAFHTGRYELCGIVSHQGRSADGGHYVAWIKERDRKDSWLCYDDEKVTPHTEDSIKKLTGMGGADWHMAYLCIYRSIEF